MDESSRLMTVDELAVLLRLNRDTTYKAVADRQIPGVHRIGRTIRISRRSILDWIDGGSSTESKRGKL